MAVVLIEDYWLESTLKKCVDFRRNVFREMTAIIKRFNEDAIFLNADNRLGSIAYTGTYKFVEANVFYTADNRRNGEVVANY